MKKGFTLAEILIVLAILGVVFTLTVPTIYNKINEKTYATLLESISSSFKSVINQTLIDERTVSLADTIYATSPESFLKKYFKISLYCGHDYNKCLASSYKSLDGTNSISVQSMLPADSFFCGTIDSGIAICTTEMSQDSSSAYGNSVVVVDINGVKRPNQNGKDLFSFNIYSDGKIGNQYDLSDNDTSGVSCRNYASTAGYGGACYSKVVADNWKINY